LTIAAIELLIARADLEYSSLPVAVDLLVMHTVMRRAEMPVAVHQLIEQAAVPGGARIDLHLEAETAVGVSRRLLLVARADVHATHKVLVAVGRGQPLVLVRPVGGDAATTYDP